MASGSLPSGAPARRRAAVRAAVSLCALFLLPLFLVPPPYDVPPSYERARGAAPLLTGIHAPNRAFNEQDYARVPEGEFDTIKMMSYHPVASYDRLRRSLPDLRFFVRLNTPWNELLAPEQFVAANAPHLRALVDAGYTPWVEIGNEPNLELHPQAEETFTAWYLEVLRGLRAAVPEAKFGFPGLARDLRELDWLEACAPAVEASDWLGVHAYWADEREMLDPRHALKLIAFHRRFPHLPMVVTEAGNYAHRVSREERGRQYARFVRVLARLPYVRAVHFYLLSGTDDWQRFFFDQSMVAAVKQASRDPLPALARLLGAKERTRRVYHFPPEATEAPAPTPTPTRAQHLEPEPTPEPFVRRRLLADLVPQPAPSPTPTFLGRWLPLAPAPAPAAALRTASSYTITDVSARAAIDAPVVGVPLALQISDTDLFTSPGATGFALLWDGHGWRLQYRREGRLAVDQRLANVPAVHDEWLQVELVLEPRSAAAWIWRRGDRQPDVPNAVFAPPEAAALDGARARALFLPDHPVADLVLEGATRYS